MMRIIGGLLLLMIIGCGPSHLSDDVSRDHIMVDTTGHAALIRTHLEEGAWRYGMYSREWQSEIDKGIAVDSTVAYFWQQKAMPLFKQGKYEVGMKFLDKAVALNPDRWLDYRAFMKCIFSKQYQAAISDFEAAKERFGNGFVMDHTYNFYIGLSYLQLNEFEKADSVFQADIANTTSVRGADWVHHLDLFYAGIAKYELRELDEALAIFDQCLAIDPQFSDALYYKANCIGRLGDREEAMKLIEEAKALAAKGYGITEDNAIYERYPYQVRWNW